jgi:threonine dehydrogenase-like Zn-dependent dehydrogenase
MRAAVLKGYQSIAIENVPVPEPKPGEVLMKVMATGLCGSDMHGYSGTHPLIRWPVILGHEASGVVAQCGEGVENWKAGDEVVLEPLIVCKKCEACLSGSYHLCSELQFAGHTVPGSLAEYMTADSCFLHRKPKNVPFEEAAVTEPAASPLHAIERVKVGVGSFIVILGCGITGSFLLQYALMKGAGVLVTDPDEKKLEIARTLGVTHTLNPRKEDLAARVRQLTGGRGADFVFEAAGTPETMAVTTKLVRKGGTIVLIGYTGRESDPFDLTGVTLGELNVLGSLAFCRDFPVTLKLMEEGKLKVRPVLTHFFPLEKAEEGIRLMQKKQEGVLKVVVHGTQG